ncbi:MAG: HAD-IIB family hydrolase, partial [Trueperaceae bacterium]
GLVVWGVWEAAERARTAGMRLGVCTARPGFGLAAKIAQRLDPDTPHVFQNGAQITYLDGDTLQVSALKESSAEVLIRAARRLGVVLELYTPNALFVERRTDISEAHAKMIGVHAIVRDLREVARAEPVVRAQWVVPPDRLDEVLAVEADGVQAHVATSPAQADTYFVSLTRPGVDKGSAVALLAKRLEIDLRNVLGVGDSPGDLPMLERVGHARVMASGDPEMLARWPDGVVPGVEACGAAEALDQAIQLRVRTGG